MFDSLLEWTSFDWKIKVALSLIVGIALYSFLDW